MNYSEAVMEWMSDALSNHNWYAAVVWQSEILHPQEVYDQITFVEYFRCDFMEAE